MCTVFTAKVKRMSERSEETSSDGVEILESTPKTPFFDYACRTGKRKVAPKKKEPPPKKQKKKEVPVPKPKQKSYRFNAVTLFATFPQCPMPKEQALQNLLDKWLADIAFAIVAHEKHESGDDHLHVLVKFKSKRDFTTENFADFIAGQHGNYQPARNLKHVITYVTKDGDFVTHGTVPQIQGKKESKFDLIAAAINEGKSLRQIRMDFPGTYLMHGDKITKYFTTKQMDDILDEKEPWRGMLIPDALKDPYGNQIATWLNTNIKQQRKFKQAQLWISGPTNIGKTSLMLQLEKYLRIYVVCLEEDFMDQFDPAQYDLVVFDEFRGQKKITWMNSFVQGGTVPVRIKGSRAIKISHRDNLPCLVLSNYSISETYHKADSIAVSTIKSRFEECQIIEDDYKLRLVHNDSISAISDDEATASESDEEN